MPLALVIAFGVGILMGVLAAALCKGAAHADRVELGRPVPSQGRDAIDAVGDDR
jgi:hypothetical protein